MSEQKKKKRICTCLHKNWRSDGHETWCIDCEGWCSKIAHSCRFKSTSIYVEIKDEE